ncbi:class I SAM-dependent methyltransferase [Amycolatopsis ultiminotia]|uniref:Class I SAM-dependent methyltransferase n=1 Tax=Amycolatopsis ultiminotia TaxID=543629 RepID=A0ABP6Y3C2_9PSEU
MKLASGREFDHGLLGRHCWLELASGERVELPVDRWTDGCGQGDAVLLDACEGPTLDVGCGPGRLTAALTRRGVVALGVDSSPIAVQLTRQRGASALQRNVFDRLPGEGRWNHVLLADGNIGIGGDPGVLLRRVRELLTGDGDVLVELEAPGHGLRRDHVRLRPRSAGGRWFTWAWVGVDAVAEVAARTGFRVDWTTSHGHRWFAKLDRA